MFLSLKTPWISRGRDSDDGVSAEFVNIQQWWNDHDQAVRPWSSLFTQGSLSTGTVNKSSNYTASNRDNVILIDSTSSVITVTLPTAITILGKRYTVKDWKGKSATNNITIATTSSQTIDGSTTKVLNQNYVSYTVVSDGANWAVI